MSHILQQPDLHDGHLTGIVMTGDTLELLCADMAGSAYSLRLTKVVRLRAIDFLQGNIIFEVVTYSDDVPKELLRKVFFDEREDPPWLEEEHRRIARGGWTLLHLTSSYGCELIALANGDLEVLRR